MQLTSLNELKNLNCLRRSDTRLVYGKCEMRIPKKLKVLGFEYKIFRPKVVKDKAGKNVLGHCVGEKLLIQIQKNLPASVAEEIFFHELLHSIDYEAPDVVKLNENRIHFLSSQLYAVLKNNGLLK